MVSEAGLLQGLRVKTNTKYTSGIIEMMKVFQNGFMAMIGKLELCI
jgi:hypothetical protein